MLTTPRELAVVEKAKAYQIGEFLLMRISGEMPNACHAVDLEQSLLDVEPPAFIATWFTRPNVRCTPDSSPYEHQEAFRIGTFREKVNLHHAGGELSVEVENLGAETETWFASPSFAPAIPSLLADPPIGGTEAVGYSKKFDFTEAFLDAIKQIPTPAIPDWLATYSVLEIGAEIGGIAGFNRMFVRVRGG